MKRFYNLLSLFLLSIVGITSAVAQDYKKGTLLETTDEVVGQQVLLYAPGTSTDHPAGFMNGTNALCEIVSDSCIYVFEAVGRQVDGYDLYRLKQVGSGKYVKDADGQDEDAFELTDEVSEAFEMTVLPYVDITDSGEACGRNTASSQKQDLSNPGFVLCRGELAAEPFEDANNEGYIYIGSVHSPFISPYSDTNMWEIWTVENTKGLEKLNNYLDMYFPSPDLSFDFPAGNSPGFYQSEVVAEAQVLVDKANDVSNGDITMSDAEIDELCAQLKAAYEKLQESKIPLSAGYYFIYNVAGRYLYGADQGNTSFLYSNSANTYQIPETLTADDVKYIWKVTPAEEGENAYLVENVLKGLVISGQEASCSGTDNGMGFTLAKTGSVKITDNGENQAPSFIFSTTASTKNGMKQFHAKFNDNPVMAWNANASENNCMHFVTVTEEEFNAVIEQAMQQQRNEKLSSVYSKVMSNVMEGTSYVWDGEKDADFTHEGALVSPTGDEATSHVFSRAKEESEGTYEALLDGDFSTYFHTNWHSAFTPSMANFHDVCFELDEAVSGIVTAKIAKRLTGNDYPTKFAVFGTNEVDKANPDAADWTLEGVANISWDTPILVDGEESERQNYVGYASFNLSQEYKYVRLAAIATIFNETRPMTDRGYFAISELNLWKGGKFDEVNSTIGMVSKPTMDALNAALAKAKEEIAAGTASDATIAELEAAYAQFVLEFPVPALIGEAADAAEAVANAAANNGLVGDDLGMYPQAEYDALVAAIQAARDYDTLNKTAAEINAQVDAVNAAVAVFKASLKLPEAGKYYVWRGKGEKYLNGQEAQGWNSLNALVYSPSNALSTNLAFTRPEGAAELLDVAELADTVDAAENLKYLWMVEKAEAGKIVLRNVGTGMYVGRADGEMGQSKEPVEINVLSARAGQFVLEVREGTHFNFYGGGAVGAWADASDQNAFVAFEEVSLSALGNTSSFYWPVEAGKLQILTLPVSVDVAWDGTAYGVAGVTVDNQLALVEMDEIPAGTPFVFAANTELTAPAYGAAFNILFEDDVTLDNGGSLIYALEPVAVEGLTGTLCEPDTVAKGFAYFNGGKIAATNETRIGVNSGYVGVAGVQMPIVEADMADETVDLGKIDLTDINNATVVVLPSVVNVYSINGQLVRKNVKTLNATKGLPAGIYVVGGQKLIVK